MPGRLRLLVDGGVAEVVVLADEVAEALVRLEGGVEHGAVEAPLALQYGDVVVVLDDGELGDGHVGLDEEDHAGAGLRVGDETDGLALGLAVRDGGAGVVAVEVVVCLLRVEPRLRVCKCDVCKCVCKCGPIRVSGGAVFGLFAGDQHIT